MRVQSRIHHRFRPLRRRGEGDAKVVIIILACVGGVLLLGCLACVLPALILPAVQQAREAARRTQSKNNLHQMGLAMHNFHDVHGQLPGGTTADGQMAHSWQTHLLPYIDQSPLYQSISLDRAWDDPSQGAAFQTVISPYHHPSQVERFTPSGYATSHYAGNAQLLSIDRQLAIQDVTDGMSFTIAAGEVSAGFKAWGDPTNVRDPAAGIGVGADQFGSSSPGGANMLLMDGSVRFISENIDMQVLQGLSTPDGGESLGSF